MTRWTLHKELDIYFVYTGNLSISRSLSTNFIGKGGVCYFMRLYKLHVKAQPNQCGFQRFDASTSSRVDASQCAAKMPRCAGARAAPLSTLARYRRRRRDRKHGKTYSRVTIMCSFQGLGPCRSAENITLLCLATIGYLEAKCKAVVLEYLIFHSWPRLSLRRPGICDSILGGK